MQKSTLQEIQDLKTALRDLAAELGVTVSNRSEPGEQFAPVRPYWTAENEREEEADRSRSAPDGFAEVRPYYLDN